MTKSTNIYSNNTTNSITNSTNIYSNNNTTNSIPKSTNIYSNNTTNSKYTSSFFSFSFSFSPPPPPPSSPFQTPIPTPISTSTPISNSPTISISIPQILANPDGESDSPRPMVLFSILDFSVSSNSSFNSSNSQDISIGPQIHGLFKFSIPNFVNGITTAM